MLKKEKMRMRKLVLIGALMALFSLMLPVAAQEEGDGGQIRCLSVHLDWLEMPDGLLSPIAVGSGGDLEDPRDIVWSVNGHYVWFDWGDGVISYDLLVNGERGLVIDATACEDGSVFLNEREPGQDPSWLEPEEEVEAEEQTLALFTVNTEPEPDLCDPSQKPEATDIAGWLADNEFEASDCFEINVGQSCGSLNAELTRDDTPYNNVFLWNIGGAPDLDNAEAFPATFAEDENGGSVEVTYYIAGPESDYFAGYGLPNFWDGGVTVTVDTDCEEPEPEPTTTTTTTVPETTTTVAEETTTTQAETTTTVAETTTTTEEPEEDPDDNEELEELPFTGLPLVPTAVGALALLGSGLGVLIRLRRDDL